MIANAYDELIAASRGRGESRDCTVVTLAVAACLPYADAHAAMRAQGRRDRHGASINSVERALKAQGFIQLPVNLKRYLAKSGERSKRITLGQVEKHPEVWGEGTYIVYSYGHVSAIVGGKLFDTGEPLRKSINLAYRIARK